MKILVAQLGARMHYAVPRILEAQGLLSHFYTDTLVSNKGMIFDIFIDFIGKNFSIGAIQRLNRRRLKNVPSEKITSFDLLGYQYALELRNAKSLIEKEDIYLKYAEMFSANIFKTAIPSSTAFWGFNGASEFIFKTAKSLKKTCILEQTILPKQLEIDILRAEIERNSDFIDRKQFLLQSNSRIASAENEEWQLADKIIVASDFVANGLQSLGVPSSKVRVVPYGVDIPKKSMVKDKSGERTRKKLKVLFVGEVGLRKGAPDLLIALDSLPASSFQAKFVGQVNLNQKVINKYSSIVDFLGVVPASAMETYFNWADVVVLPSLVEGSPTVIYEAISFGKPVITTPNAGSVVEDGVHGRIIPPGSPAYISQALAAYIEDEELLEYHSRNSFDGRNGVSFATYKEALSKALT